MLHDLRVPLIATLLFAIVVAALQWRGDLYDQALRHYEAGRYAFVLLGQMY